MEQNLKISHSTDIKELVSALTKAQGVMKPAIFNRVNPHFKTRYADFTSCMDACRGPLSENGLAPIQYCETIEGKLNLVTMLAHVSGQWMKSEFPLIPAKMDSQGIGSAMTYAKRYSLCGMVGIVADEEGDDDGEAAVGRGKQEETFRQPPRPAPIVKLAEEGKKNVKAFTKISNQQVETLKNLESKLDEECKGKIYSWLENAHDIKNFKDVHVDIYNQLFKTLENAVKFIGQNKLEAANA